MSGQAAVWAITKSNLLTALRKKGHLNKEAFTTAAIELRRAPSLWAIEAWRAKYNV